MTLDEYEKIREEKRKALLAMKSEERKVVIDEELEKLQPLSLKKDNSEIFIKLVSLLVFLICNQVHISFYYLFGFSHVFFL